MRDAGTLMLAWFATAWLHGAILLACAWLAERVGALASPALRELVWRTALLAPLLTATAQLGVLARFEFAPQPLRFGVPVLVAEPAPRDPNAIVTAVPAEASSRVDNAVQRTNVAVGTAPAREPREPVLRAAVAEPLRMPARVDLIALAGFAWALLAALALSRVAVGFVRTLRSAAQLEPIADDELHALARRLAADARCAMPKLVRAEQLASPLAIAPRTICIPDWALSQLGPDQRAAMLAHEIAHLGRRDPWWRVALAAAAVLLPVPGAARARARLEELAEHACDAWGARASGQRLALAECLAACMERHCHSGLAAHGVAMARPRSPVVERVKRLIEEQPMKFEAIGGSRRVLLAVAIVAAVILLPGFALEIVAAERGTSVHTSKGLFGSGKTEIQITQDDYELEVDADGDFGFTAAEDDVATLAAGASLEINETRDGARRKVEFTRDGERIARRYWVEGTEKPWDAAARAWLAELLPRVMRESGLDAEGRVARIHARGGAAAVIAEIELVSSDYVRSRYLSLLFAKGPLTATELDRVIAMAGKIESDYERRTTLVTLLEAQKLAPAQQSALLGVVASFASDYERRLVLEQSAKALSPQAREAWFAALERMSSDYESRTALGSLVAHTNDAATMGLAVAATEKMSSDYERRTVLAEIAPKVEGSDTLATAYVRAAGGIGSDYERREALLALMGEQREMSAGASAAVLDAVEDMGSDYEARQVLVELAGRMPDDAQLIRRYRLVSRALGDHERGQAEKALDRFDG